MTALRAPRIGKRTLRQHKAGRSVQASHEERAECRQDNKSDMQKTPPARSFAALRRGTSQMGSWRPRRADGWSTMSDPIPTSPGCALYVTSRRQAACCWLNGAAMMDACAICSKDAQGQERLRHEPHDQRSCCGRHASLVETRCSYPRARPSTQDLSTQDLSTLGPSTLGPSTQRAAPMPIQTTD